MLRIFAQYSGIGMSLNTGALSYRICLPPFVQKALLVALAKSLANSQGSGELGCLADHALAARG